MGAVFTAVSHAAPGVIVAGFLGAWLAALAIVTCRVLRPPKRAPAPGAAPLYTVVRICGGVEPHLRENLLSVLHVAEPPAAVVLVVPHDDLQRATVAAVRDTLQAAGMPTALVPTDVHGANHKVAQLHACIHLWPADHDIVCADGDVDLTGYPLGALRAPLADDGVAAVWAPCAETGHAPAAAVLHSSLHCFALLGRIDAHGMVGKLWAVRRATLLRAGGWASLIDTLGEDMELARRFRALGLRVVMANVAARSRAAPRTLAATVARYARWFWVIRAQRPLLLPAYPLLFFGTAGVLVLCALQARATGGIALAAAGAAVLLRVALSFAARRALGTGYRRLVRDSFVADAVMGAAFIRMLSQRTVRWRHQRLHVSHGGRIASMEAAP